MLAVPQPVAEVLTVTVEEAVAQKVPDAEPQNDSEAVGERDWDRVAVKLLVTVPLEDCEKLGVSVADGVKLTVPQDEAQLLGVFELVPQVVSETVGDRD